LSWVSAPGIDVFMKKIPKIIHQIWFGENRPVALMERVRKTHPDYRYMFWNCDILPQKMHNPDLFHAARYYAEKSDILRYEVLFKYGGLYIDADCFVLKRFDDLLDHPFTSWEHERLRPGLIQNGIMGFTPAHPMLVELFQQLKYSVNLQHDISCWQSTGPLLLSKAQKCVPPANRLKLYPSQYFVPIHYENLQTYTPGKAIEVAQEMGSHTLHLWGSSLGYNSNLFARYSALARKLPF